VLSTWQICGYRFHKTSSAPALIRLASLSISNQEKVIEGTLEIFAKALPHSRGRFNSPGTDSGQVATGDPDAIGQLLPGAVFADEMFLQDLSFKFDSEHYCITPVTSTEHNNNTAIRVSQWVNVAKDSTKCVI
jgi:hypothetical protein